MDESQQKAQFSIAFFHAVAAVCGLKLFRCDVDDESVDITVGRTGGGGTIRSPRLDVQLKCSGRELLKPDGLHLQLKRKNYDDLRAAGCHVPRILVVLLVLPRGQLFHPQSLQEIMDRVGKRELQ